MNKKLKNIRNVFVRYRNPYQSLHKRFIACEQRDKKFENDIIEATSNPTFINTLKYIRASGLRKLNILDNNILGLLDRLTDEEVSEEELNTYIDTIKKRHSKTIIDITRNGRDNVIIKLKDREIEGAALSYVYPKIAEYYPAIKTLPTRKGKCHSMAMAIAQGLEETASVVTGSFYTVTPKARFLHSWVEEEIDNETYCYDFTFNIALKKEDYYKLFHVIPYEKISAKQLKEDRYTLAKLIAKDETYAKLYLSSRDEAIEIAKTLPDIDLEQYR